jgi:hypothetical protein
MRRIYELLLRLYPPEVRTPLGPEMSAVFAEMARDRRAQGWIPFVRFLVAECAGLLRGAATAHRAAHRPELDLRMMRPPGVSRQAYIAAVDDLVAAQRTVDVNLGRMQQAIARSDFVKARFYSDEDRKARANLRHVRRKYGLTG